MTRIPLILLALFNLGAGAALNLRLSLDSTVWVEPPPSAKWEGLDPRMAKLATSGLWPSLVDWLWLKIVLDPSTSKVPRGAHPAIYHQMMLATDLDPAFFEVYALGSGLLAVIRDDGVGARDLLVKGQRFRRTALKDYPEWFREQHWAQEWSLSLMLAYVQLFELEDLPAAAREFIDAAAAPGSPAYLRNLAVRLAQPGGHYEVGLKVLNHMIAANQEASVREGLLIKKHSLEVGLYLDALGRLPKGRKLPAFDPWGGRLTRDKTGRWLSTTPHERVFGLE